ncbi:xanthine dehydrogenase family protein molybdopterin-binding subunit [Alteribacillus sp. YIM 98480]|uniref:xanthine dehydrogenase family protein molybdopterin-binding subunit n=1 Tax=Alteribacillus sp. YIM 98480 TaxID=2606599 RepID=UPI00131DF7C6|nr:xanthine dehydrogenase family protein molybdopterin-binding subunit [Alteribacillus sp. YIM 98480]
MTKKEQQNVTPYKWVGKKNPPVENHRFVLGSGTYVDDIKMDNMHHAALVPSPYAHAAIKSIDTSEALNVPGVIAVVTGEDIVQSTNPLKQYLEIPGVDWYPLAAGSVKYAGEWVAAVVAEDRFIAEDAAELVKVEYEPLPNVLDPEKAMSDNAVPVHDKHPSNIMWQRKFTWGEVESDFNDSDDEIEFRCRWNRNSTVPLETFGVITKWDEGRKILDVWASIQMPQYPEQIAEALKIPLNCVRVHYDVDVGGSYGVKRGIKHTVLVGYISKRYGVPVKLIEDRLENMRGSDMHGPDRIFDVKAAFDKNGKINSLKMRTIDDEGAYPGRSPLQMGKPIGAIVGAYKIKSVEYEGVAVTTNKTGQVAVRGFGQSPTNFAIEMAVDKVAKKLGLSPIEIRKQNFIQPQDFPYQIPSGTTYDSGDYPAVLNKALKLANYEKLLKWQEEERKKGRMIGIGVATCIEPGGGNALFEPLLNPKNDKTTFPESCQVKVDQKGKVTASIAFSSAGQGHQTLVATILAEELNIDRDDIRVVYSDSLSSLPSQSPVASRMAIVLGGATSGAARRIKDKMIKIAAHNLNEPPEQLYWDGSTVKCNNNSHKELTWDEIVKIAHITYHKMPEGMDPGIQSQFVLEVPTGGTLPTPDGKVQMYPCYSFSAHIPVVELNPDTGKVEFLNYYIADDCGTVINPDIVKGMVVGGVAHGIGAALYEQFSYDNNGQMIAQTFMDYLLPSTMEVPHIDIVKHCTPSPLTSMGQKGVGEGGYMSAPAAIVNAVNDALVPFDSEISHVPITPYDVIQKIFINKGGTHIV